MALQQREPSFWWIVETILLAISGIAFLMLVSLMLTRLLHGLGLIGEYSIPDLYLDGIETSPLGLACCILGPLILALMPRLRR